MSWRIGYSDGAGNAYSFIADNTDARFVYDPVTPDRSSTGTYSGGEPRAGMLDAMQVFTLWRLVRALAANPALHVADRGKGTGAFRVSDADGERSFIILRGAELAAFDSFAAAL